MDTEELFAKHLLDTKDIDIKDGLTGDLGKFIRAFWGYEYTCFLAGFQAGQNSVTFNCDKHDCWGSLKKEDCKIS